MKATNVFAEPPFHYRLKDVRSPSRYLGANIGKQQLDDGTEMWFISPDKCLTKEISIVGKIYGWLKAMFKSKFDVPASPDYHPELDNSEFLNNEGTKVYQSYIIGRDYPLGKRVRQSRFSTYRGDASKIQAAPQKGQPYGCSPTNFCLHQEIYWMPYRCLLLRTWLESPYMDFGNLNHQDYLYNSTWCFVMLLMPMNL